MDFAKTTTDGWVECIKVKDDVILKITEDKRELKREIGNTLKVFVKCQSTLDDIKKSLSEIQSDGSELLLKFKDLPIPPTSDPVPPSRNIDAAFIDQLTKMNEEFNTKVKFEKALLFEVKGLNKDVLILTSSLNALIENISDCTVTLKESCSTLVQLWEAALRMSGPSN
ncbi:PREDICTED: uncharacterized protein LOC109161670 [Ipomoea nil]|uniref:uncharacterized protein LOC109161670 n=1 Tax=Ipomoea nil TaxID=35883 RepID=UPI000901FB10|nr:PREDICTED: uncharacterized protein LOC109161670 [Ipomoea nil]